MDPVTQTIEHFKRKQGATKKLGERLIAGEIIDEQQLREGLSRQKETGSFLGETLVELGYVKPNDMATYLVETMGFPFVSLPDTEIDVETARLIDESFARRKMILPFAIKKGTVQVAMADPLDLSAIDRLRAELKAPVEPFLAFRSSIEDAINTVFDVGMKATAVLDEIDIDFSELTVDELVGMAEDAPIVRVVNTVIQGAIQAEASDIHIEPQEGSVRVRYRLDGVLYDQMTIPKHHLAACVSRIKIMSYLNISERRRPQDGRFTYSDPGGKVFDLRVSIMPTIYGEKVVMRLLEKSNHILTLNRLGFFEKQQLVFESMIHRPHGIVLVTGPTGSGKSTTLHAGLQLIGNTRVNINTVEDPVEYHLKGANQVQVNPKIGLTFASTLRTFLRQDPDVIMVGEIRDFETAEIAIQAALTGHLVLSTIHTNDAPSALVRLVNMGIEPYLIASAVLGCIGQRLLRTVCPGCKEMVVPDSALALRLGLAKEGEKVPKVAYGGGCARCGSRGMKGRTAAFEVMAMNDDLNHAILRRASGSELMDIARASGMETIQESGVQKLRQGITTPEEVLRVLFIED